MQSFKSVYHVIIFPLVPLSAQNLYVVSLARVIDFFSNVQFCWQMTIGLFDRRISEFSFFLSVFFFFFRAMFLYLILFFLILFLKFTILYWFCQILKWIHHRYTCVPHPEPSSLLPPHTLPLGRPSAPAPSIQYRASNLDWQFISYMILYMFQCHSPKSSHPLPLPQSP